jgi:predicted regulator of Ras-like GTPase activity (Roadblock/LC7/MglB family)
MSSLETPLEAVLESVSGARAAALLGLDGMPVATVGARGDLPLDLIAASYADLARRGSRSSRESGLSDTVELVVVAAGGTVVLRIVDDEYGLLVVLEPHGSLGRARYEMYKAAVVLEHELGA